MKHFFLLVTVLAFSVISCKEDKSKKVETHHEKPVEKVATSGEFKVLNSKMTWKGFKATSSHNGEITIKEGKLYVKDNKLVGGEFEIDMNSITNSDIAKDDPYNKKLVDHLKNADFFDVQKYPKATFEITNVSVKDEISIIEGNLTIKGITKNISFPASVLVEKSGVTLLSDKIKIDRTDFGIKYKSGKFFKNLKDKLINDIFEVSFKIAAK